MTDLRVMNYNVRAGKDDRAALADVVRGERPDVVIVQEGARRFRWRSKNARLAREWDMVLGAGGLWSLGNLVMTTHRVKVVETRELQFDLTPGRHMRGMVIARCSVGFARFAVAGCHLSLDAAERISQATELRKQIADLDEPVIIGVDANEESGGSAWRITADGLTDAAGEDCTLTFSCAKPRKRIDGIFVDPRIEVTGYRVLDDERVRVASDHFPMVADLRLPEA